MKGRAKMRGDKLLPTCYYAHTTKNEYGDSDSRVYCFGLLDASNDEPLDVCLKCGAFVVNAKPLEEEST